MILNKKQLHHLTRLQSEGEKLAEAKRQAEKAKTRLVSHLLAALDDGVPMLQAEQMTGVNRSDLIRWVRAARRQAPPEHDVRKAS
jgi:predicted transcriptional regulator